MSNPVEKHAPLARLLQRLSDGLLTTEEARQLNDLLLGDPDACEIYLNHLTLEAHLQQELGTREPVWHPAFERPQPLAGRARPWGFSFFRFFNPRLAAGAAAVVALASLLAWLLWTRPAPAGDAVATLLFADDCHWSGRSALMEGQRLAAGPLRLDRGLAVVRFDSGAAMVLNGEVEMDLESRSSARLHKGQLVVRAPQQAAGFTVRTPASEVIDLGTEFAVAVGKGGATEVHVLEGSLVYGKPNLREGQGQILLAGKAVRFDRPEVPTPREVPLSAPRFEELIGQAKRSRREELPAAHEPFEYPPGRRAASEANGGRGWGGPWRVFEETLSTGDASKTLQIALARWRFPWMAEDDHGRSLEVVFAPRWYLRPLRQPVRLDRAAVYYVSLIVRWELAAPLDGPSKWLAQVRALLRSSKDMSGDCVGFVLPGSGFPRIETRSGVCFNSQTPVKLNETQLWVGKIVARRNGEDEIFFRIYGESEPVDLLEPDNWHVTTRGIHSDAHLDMFVFATLKEGTSWLGNVRVGASWRAILPPQAFAQEAKSDLMQTPNERKTP